MGKARQGDAGPARPEAPDPDLDGFVTSVLAASWLLAGVSSRSVEGVDRRTTLTQFRTLAVLARGPINLSRLADELGVNVSTAMRSVDRLIAFGYATREENPQSRREVVLCLSSSGQQFVAAVFERRRGEIALLLEGMSQQATDDLVAGLGAFVAAAQKVGIRPGAPAVLGW